MESVHCFSCFSFPSRNVKFYVTNCMHIFCEVCKLQCDSDGLNPSKCSECGSTSIRMVSIEPAMPEQVKQMFTPVQQDVRKLKSDLERVLTFQNKQRESLIAGLSKKEQTFDKLRVAHNEERKKKDLYKKELEKAREVISQQEAEIFQLRAERPDITIAASPSSEIRVFSDSMYKTPKPLKSPEFLRSKSPKDPMDMFKTPSGPPKTSLGFVTPANPSHMFPHLAKYAPKTKKHGSQ